MPATAMRFWRLFRWIALLGSAAACSPNPAAPPAPPAEIPSALVIPSDITIGALELASGEAAALKRQGVPANVRDQINNVVGIVEESNFTLDAALVSFKNRPIPVSADLTTFELGIPSGALAGTMKIDFRPFDLDGDGAEEACTGCTCPVGCAPDLTSCPTEAPETDLRPICIRIWHNDRRFVAGVFDRVPTAENQESGRLLITFLSPLDLEGSLSFVDYDRHDPQDKSIDLASFRKDTGTEFFARLRTVASEEGPAASVKKTFRLTDDFFGFSADSLFQGQVQFFTDEDPMLLESIGSGFFEPIEDVTPPICASISTAAPIAGDLCGDLGLSLTPGNFPPLPELEDVDLPPFAEFPELPTF